MKLMSKKKKAKKTTPLKVPKIQKVLEQQPEKNNTLVLGGVLPVSYTHLTLPTILRV